MPNDGLAQPLKVFQVRNKPCQTNGDLDSHFPEVRRNPDGTAAKNWKKHLASDIQIALNLCGECDLPTKERCLSFALDNQIQYGIWGGTTPDDRKVISRRTRVVSNG
jgi:hypothetical protein